MRLSEFHMLKAWVLICVLFALLQRLRSRRRCPAHPTTHFCHMCAQLPRLDKTADYVAGLGKYKLPSFCECCIRAKLRKRNASKDPAVRPNAFEPPGQVSLDLVEFTVHKDETLATIDGYKYACPPPT